MNGFDTMVRLAPPQQSCMAEKHELDTNNTNSIHVPAAKQCIIKLLPLNGIGKSCTSHGDFFPRKISPTNGT